jgi:hypothetical protein
MQYLQEGFFGEKGNGGLSQEGLVRSGVISGSDEAGVRREFGNQRLARGIGATVSQRKRDHLRVGSEFQRKRISADMLRKGS